MKYIKQFETDIIRSEKSINDFLEYKGYRTPNYFVGVFDLNCTWAELTNLDGIEKLTNLRSLDCFRNKLENLNGIEKLTKLTKLDCEYNEINDLSALKNLINLKRLNCYNNKIRNLNDIEHLENLKEITCYDNDWEYPLPIKMINKCSGFVYTSDQQIYFKSYDFQKMFLDKFPEKVLDLKHVWIGYNTELLNNPDYTWIFDQESNGFFGLK